MITIAAVRKYFINELIAENFTTDRTGAQTIEMIGASFIADEEDLLNNPHWRSTKMCSFLDQAYEKLLELKGEEYADYALPIDEPTITPFHSKDSLCPQVVVTFATTLPGRKVLN